MTLQEARRALDGFLKKVTSTLGFRHIGCLEYARQVGDATALLSWPCRLDPRGFGAFTGSVGLHFEHLASWLSDDPKKMVATVGTPLHFLREHKSFVEWKFTSADDLESLSDQISSDLRNLAVPFIEQYSRLPSLRKAVESSDPKDWLNLGLNQDSRINVLAAIQLVEGDKSEAIKTLNDALAERKSALPKRRFDIEHLRKRLLEVSQTDR